MRSFDEVVELATAQQVRLRVNADVLSRVTESSVDGLFHVPLLALTILVLARAKKVGLPTADMGTWTLATLAKHFETLRLPQTRLRWSVLLRRRCADALVFLERARLVAVTETPNRMIIIGLLGRDFLLRAEGRADEIGLLTRQLGRALRKVEQTGLELL